MNHALGTFIFIFCIYAITDLSIKLRYTRKILLTKTSRGNQ